MLNIRNFRIYLYNKVIVNQEKDNFPIPVWTLSFFGPSLEVARKTDEFGEVYVQYKSSIPMWFDIVKSDTHFSVSFAFLLGWRLSYQWGY